MLSSSRSSEEITDQYYDAQAHLTALRTQEERLLAILEKADDLESVIKLEEALTEVRYEIEDLTGTIKRYDSLVDMATVTVSIREVSSTSPVSATPTTLGGRIAQQFRTSLQSLGGFGEDLIVFFVGNLPVLLVWAAVISGVFFGGRKIWRRVKSKRTGDSDNEKLTLFHRRGGFQTCPQRLPLEGKPLASSLPSGRPCPFSRRKRRF